MMGRITGRALVALMAAGALAFAGCGSDDDGGSASAGGGGSGGGGGEGLTVGFSTPDLSASFWVSMAYGVQDEAKKQGVKVVTVNAGGDANANEQISQLQDLIQQQVDGIVIGATNGDAVKSVVDQAAAQKIPVVGLSSIPNSDKLASKVGADHYGMGKIQAQCLSQALHGKGNVGMMAGPAGQSWADDRAKGFKETLSSEAPGNKVVTVSRLADNRNSALTTAEDWLQRFKDLDGVYTASDDIGAGVVDAIKAGGKNRDITVTSSNFSPAAEQLLKNGGFSCVSVQQIVEQGRQAVRQAIAAAKGEPVEKDVVTDVIKISKDNINTVDFGPIRAPEGFKP
jgi:TMAO reductase system protein TorT